MRNTICINLFGGPAIGKSTVAAELFAEIKKRHLEAEIVFEYAKDLIWDGREHVVIENQIAVLAGQWNRIHRLIGKVDLILCDSPILLCSTYAPDSYPISFHDLALWCHRAVPSINFSLTRHDASYQDVGRIHCQKTAREMDKKIKIMLEKHRIEVHHLPTEDPSQTAIDHLEKINVL